MDDGSRHAEELVDAVTAAPLVAALSDVDPETRIEALWALVSLPLSPAVWRSVVQYANATLAAGHGRSASERCAVIKATPWIPFGSVRDTVTRLSRGELDNDPVVRVAAADAVRKMSETAINGDWSPANSTGFTLVSDDERDQLSAASDDQLWDELRAPTPASHTRVALIVTALIERFSRTTDVESADRLLSWVESNASDFRPDLQGLFGVYSRLRKDSGVSPTVESMFIGWQVAWLVSRGGVIPLLTGLDVQLNSSDRDERSAAISLIQYAAAFGGSRSAPSYGIGVGVDPVDPRPGVPPRTELLDESEMSPTPPLDEDVQFTVYRPTRVQPQRWYPLLAFAHRTDPIEGPTGEVMNPVEEVARQAATLLSAAPGSFDLLRADSEFGLVRGTDLRFEPWLDTGEFNPAQASLRWEEPIHRVEFRLRVPASSAGRRLKGGLRVFIGPMLIGEVPFQLPVSATATDEIAPSTQESAKRFRQIFASYSHRDSEVVEEVERYVSLTGDRYMIDVRTLRSGEVWDDRLRELIDEADIFQLFWSRNAMYSPYVRQEWEYALQLGREGFVRPVYWEEPLPEDPQQDLPTSELRKLHFSRVRAEPATSTTPPQIVCPTCGFRCEADQKFCPQCGAFLEWASQHVESPAKTAAAPPPPSQAAAPAASAAQPQMAQPNVPAPSRRRSPIALIVGAVIAVVVIVAAIALLI